MSNGGGKVSHFARKVSHAMVLGGCPMILERCHSNININININEVDKPRGGGVGQVDKVFCNIKTLFEAFLAFLDTH